MSRPIIETANLTKTYDGFTAVNRLNLRIEEGEIFGFLGPNGAGKTTTILMLLGLTEPTSGKAKVCGYDPTREPLKVKRLAGYLPENLGLYEDLTAEENLRFIARLNGIADRVSSEKMKALLALVGLSEVAQHRVETFSKGMKQRLGVAGVLIKEPRVVFLDEPTAGLDPEGASFLLDLIVKMSKEQNSTVLLSSHLLHQVQRVCHRVGILSRGSLVAQGPVERLARETFSEGGLTVEAELVDIDSRLIERLRQIKGVANISRSGASLVISCDKDVRAQISRAILESGSALVQMRVHGYGLEEIYMRYFREE